MHQGEIEQFNIAAGERRPEVITLIDFAKPLEERNDELARIEELRQTIRAQIEPAELIDQARLTDWPAETSNRALDDARNVLQGKHAKKLLRLLGLN